MRGACGNMPTPAAEEMSRFRIDTLDSSSALLLDECTTLLFNAFADPERYNRERIRQELRCDDPVYYRRFFIAVEKHQIVAVGGVKAADWASRTHILYLSAVAPEKRGHGIGRALIKARLDWLKSNFTSGRVLVSASKSRRFRDLGFRELRHGHIGGKHLMLLRF